MREIAALGAVAALTAGSWTAYALGAGLDGHAAATPPTTLIQAPMAAPEPIKVTQPPATVSRPVNVSQILNEASTLTSSGIPTAALNAYRHATRWANSTRGCQMPWQVLGGIGLIESNHGRHGHSVLTKQGISVPGVYGPELNGQNGFALIPDSDHGVFDRDKAYDRAVGPLQFIPSTWRVVARSATGKTPNPQNINDAAMSAAAYLCAGGRNLSTSNGLISAIFSYNHSNNYVNAVLAVMRAYGDSSVPAPLPPDPSPSSSASASASASAVAKATKTAAPTKSAAPTSSGAKPPGATTGTTHPGGGPRPTPTPAPTPTASKTPCTNLLGLLCSKS